MSDSVLTIDIQDVDATRRHLVRRAIITFGAGDYTAGGNTLDLSGATNTPNKAYAKFTSNPVVGVVLNHPKAFVMKLVKGSGLTNWKTMLFTTGGGNAQKLVEYSGALPADITGDTDIEVEFRTAKGK